MNTLDEINKKILEFQEMLKNPKSDFEKEKVIHNLKILYGFKMTLS